MPFVPRLLTEPPVSTSSGQALDKLPAPECDDFASNMFDPTPAMKTPLPPQSAEELSTISAPLTPMEKVERAGFFGSEPLRVADGIAVTEEAVVLHVPDLIAQF